MKQLLRAVFVGLGLLAVAAQAARFEADARTAPRAGPEEALRSLGLTVEPAPASGVVTAAAPGCDAPVRLTGIRFDGLGRAATSELLEAPSRRRFVYLGEVGDRFDRLSVVRLWAVASVLRAIGLREGDVPGEVVVVSLPLGCPELADLDWASLSPSE